MLEGSRAVNFKLDKIVIPMAKGQRSRKALRLGFDFSRALNTEITALTVKDSSRELTWSDKVHVVTSAYKLGKEMNVKVIPKIITNRSVRSGIVNETANRNYDLLLMASDSHSFFARSLFGGNVDYIIRHVSIPVAALGIRTGNYPYTSIVYPMSEMINTRSSLAFSLAIKKSIEKPLRILDLRYLDSKPQDRFRFFRDHFDQIIQKYGGDVSFIRDSAGKNYIEVIRNGTSGEKNPLLVLGVRPDQNGRVKLPAELREINRSVNCDILLVKK
ncbi:MAG: universal stress protein [Candidatus Thermoplasmatota archaeon]|nr:universal stress protein [Candidatus Thermoplasmatota archaeon]MCL5730869.1 universal stress protein [Candidatus Thermoplasmatota archaeon]